MVLFKIGMFSLYAKYFRINCPDIRVRQCDVKEAHCIQMEEESRQKAADLLDEMTIFPSDRVGDMEAP